MELVWRLKKGAAADVVEESTGFTTDESCDACDAMAEAAVT